LTQLNEHISFCVCKSNHGGTISAHAAALLFTVGGEIIVLAYNRVQNNGEMLFLGQALMMLQSEARYITSLDKKERQNLLKQGLPNLKAHS
jgi:hypothetical protein